MKKEFKQYLINQNLSANTINSYLFTLNQLHKMYDIVSNQEKVIRLQDVFD